MNKLKGIYLRGRGVRRVGVEVREGVERRRGVRDTGGRWEIQTHSLGRGGPPIKRL